jgi:hypothetical protein
MMLQDQACTDITLCIRLYDTHKDSESEGMDLVTQERTMIARQLIEKVIQPNHEIVCFLKRMEILDHMHTVHHILISLSTP